ncbi:MAG: hypothetical protein KAS32_19665 [Candidatus Peribacteraceae bacterium]|nr:hypothetical protein [Candidatus Peribacteraceae bacterium]
MDEDKQVVKRFIGFISRSNDEERLVTGIVADPENIDSEGNMIDKEAIRRSALLFMERFGNTGVSHETDSYDYPVVFNDRIKIVESWVAREATTLNDLPVPEGAWLLTYRVLDDEIWEDVKRGALTGFSFEALVKKKPIEQKSIQGN